MLHRLNGSATASLDGTARIWDAQSGALLHTIAADAGEVRNVDFSPDGRFFVTAHADGAVRIWNLEDSDTLIPSRVLIGHSSVVWDAAFHPDGSSLATIGFDGTVRFWDVESGEEILVLAGAHNGPDLEFSPDGRQLAVTSGDGVIRIYVLALDDLVQVALSRLTRGFTDQECMRYLHVEGGCP